MKCWESWTGPESRKWLGRSYEPVGSEKFDRNSAEFQRSTSSRARPVEQPYCKYQFHRSSSWQSLAQSIEFIPSLGRSWQQHPIGQFTNHCPPINEDTVGVTDVLPPFPAPIIDFFPNGLPKFDPDGVIRWFNRPTEPKCDEGKFAFCYQQGPAQLYWSQKPSAAPTTAEQIAEHAQILRKCRNCE